MHFKKIASFLATSIHFYASTQKIVVAKKNSIFVLDEKLTNYIFFAATDTST